MKSAIRDIGLAPTGIQKIEWAKKNMPLLRQIQLEFLATKPFEGLKIALSIHLEAKTAYLCQVLASGGARMFVTGSNPLSTQDDVAAALVSQGISVFAWHNPTPEEYSQHIDQVLENQPHIVIDDGGDLVDRLHRYSPSLIENVIGGCEETATGLLRLRAMEAAGELKFPMIAVNDARCKYLFDNRYGTGQSVWDGINRTTNLIVAGKTVVIAGYGWCGKGIAMRAKGMGAHVIITEIDPVKAMEAVMDGHQTMPMAAAALEGDLFITATGCKDVITVECMKTMKNNAILCNAGHFNVEVAMDALNEAALKTSVEKNNIKGYTLDGSKWLYVLAEGRLVNLAAGDGHPVEIMDMSFAIQALSAAYLVENKDSLTAEVVPVPDFIDDRVARLKLASWGLGIDRLSEEQRDYLYNWTL